MCGSCSRTAPTHVIKHMWCDGARLVAEVFVFYVLKLLVLLLGALGDTHACINGKLSTSDSLLRTILQPLAIHMGIVLHAWFRFVNFTIYHTVFRGDSPLCTQGANNMLQARAF